MEGNEGEKSRALVEGVWVFVQKNRYETKLHKFQDKKEKEQYEGIQKPTVL